MICMKSGAQLEQTDQIVSFFVLFRFALKPGDLAPQALQAFPLQFLSLFVLRLHICFFDAHTAPIISVLAHHSMKPIHDLQFQKAEVLAQRSD